MSETAARHIKCKSCDKGGDDVAYLIGLSKRVFICDACVEMCRDIIGARRVARRSPDTTQERTP